ncbi:MAG: hypothetical protein U0930_15660 [Pirellulales bacterium]
MAPLQSPPTASSTGVPPAPGNGSSNSGQQFGNGGFNANRDFNNNSNSNSMNATPARTGTNASFGGGLGGTDSSSTAGILGHQVQSLVLDNQQASNQPGNRVLDGSQNQPGADSKAGT